ncbi:MAG: hypothetical protein WDA04_05925 [Anaerolineaceae bacterium]|jgi:hypothetical protein
MSYDIKLTKNYEAKPETVISACKKVAVELGGKVLTHDENAKILHIQMDKKLQGNVLGDRSKLEIKYSAPTDESTQLDVLAYPLNVVGQKLMFGARPGVVQTVLKVFFEQVEGKLKA